MGAARPRRSCARVPSWEWLRMHVDPARSRAVVTAARVAESLERTVGLPSDEVDRRLRSLPGIGVWTSAEVRQRAHGDADAVSFGDYHVAKDVGWALTGAPFDDAALEAFLEPWRPHRGRVPALVGRGRAAPAPPRRPDGAAHAPAGPGHPDLSGTAAQSSGRRGASTNSVNLRCRSRASHSLLVSSRQLDSSARKISSSDRGQRLVDDLDVDLVVALQAEPVDVRGPDRGPVAVHRGGLGVHHGVAEAEDPHAGVEQLGEVAARDPVGDDVVRLQRDEQPHVHAAPRRRLHARRRSPGRG